MLHSDISNIISGCESIVSDLEHRLYDRNFRLSHLSDTDLCLLSMKDHIDTDFNNIGNGFRLRDVKNWLPEPLKNINSRIIRRNSTMLLNSNYLRRDRLEKTKNNRSIIKKKPRRTRLNDIQLHADRGPKSFYTYSKSEYLLPLQRLALGFASRAIIYTILRNSGILERFLKICEYKKILEIKYTNRNEMLKRLRTQTETIGLIPESDFNVLKYTEERSKLLSIKRKKMLKSIASEKAKLLVQELDWSDRIYTRFFIAGGITFGSRFAYY